MADLDALRADPFCVCGPLCAATMLAFLDAKSLIMASLVSRSWKAAAYADNKLWGPHCQALWADKAWVPEDVCQAADCRAAYGASLADAQRDEITKAELCHFTFTFSFKLPLWFTAELSRLKIQRFFNDNHTVTSPVNDPLWGGVEPPRHYWFFREGHDGQRMVQVNSYPPLRSSRTSDWGWRLENAMVQLVIDPAAGPNPGLAASDPAAQQPLTAEQIEAVFVGLVDDDDDAEMHAEDDGGDEGEEEQDEEEHRQGEGAQAPEGASTSSSSSSPEGSDLGDDGEEDPGAEEKGAAAMADSDAEGGQPASADAHNMVTD